MDRVGLARDLPRRGRFGGRFDRMNAMNMVTTRFRGFPPADFLRRRIRSLLRPRAAPTTPAAALYQPGGWIAGDLPGGGWNREGVALAQEAHWPVLLRNLE